MTDVTARLDAIQAKHGPVGCESHENCLRADLAYLLDLARAQQAALDDLLYIAENKTADNLTGRWWRGIIKGTIEKNMEAKP